MTGFQILIPKFIDPLVFDFIPYYESEGSLVACATDPGENLCINVAVEL